MDEQRFKVTHKPAQDPSHLHRVQSFLQIWLPLGLVILICIGLAFSIIVVTRSGSADLGKVQVVAIIWLIVPLGLIGLLSFITLILAIYGTSRLFTIAPGIRRISNQVRILSDSILSWSNRIMMPFTFVNNLRHRMKPGRTKTPTE